MIKQKLYEFLLWLKDHFLILVEVTLRLHVGSREENKTTKTNDEDGGNNYDI